MVKFFEPYPTFGTKNKRLPLSRQELSPYYWWWYYLRRNQDYIKCCDNEGSGKLSKLYADFGDVRDKEFRVWWRIRGVDLFAEQIKTYKFCEINSKDQIPEQWDETQVLYLQIPLNYDKRSLKKYFNQLLMTRHTRKRGRSSNKNKQITAKYKLNSTYTIANLRLSIQVYDRYMENKHSDKKLKLWELGVEMGLLDKDSMPSPQDDKNDRLVKRNRLGATVGRYVNQAKTRIKNVALGEFPRA